MPEDLQIHCDVLVIGGGIAAVAAACKLRELGCDVVLVDKGAVGRSGCTPLASGVFHYYTPDDDQDVILRALSNPLTNHRLLQANLPNTFKALQFLESAGVKFIKDGDQIVRVGGPRMPIPHSAMMAGGGPQMGLALRAETLRRGVRVVNRVMVTGLLTSDGELPTGGRVIGAVGFGTRDARCHVFQARAVIVCTGPFGIPYNRFDASFVTRTMPIEASGEGINLMYAAGAVMGKLEMGYRTPYPAELPCAPAMEMLVALGGNNAWINQQGQRFLSPEFRSKLFGRSSVTVAILKENIAGRGPAGVNISHLTPEERRLFKQVVPIVAGNFESAGYNLKTDTIPYTAGAPAVRGVNGAGARINSRGETSVAGLYAAGNCCDGAYIYLGQTLDTCVINGWWAAEAAAGFVSTRTADAPDHQQVAAQKSAYRAPLERTDGLPYQDVVGRVADLQISLTPTMNAQNLTSGRRTLEALIGDDIPRIQAREERDLCRIASLRYSLPVLELVLATLEHRQESRGNVIRDDYPHTDNIEWLTHTVMQRSSASGFRLWDIPIPDDYWLLPPQRDRSLHPYFTDQAR